MHVFNNNYLKKILRAINSYAAGKIRMNVLLLSE